MTRIHFLTVGFVDTNTRAILFPLIVRRHILESHGIVWRAFTAPHPSMFDCDVLVVESNVHGKRWNHDTPGILEEFEEYRDKVDRLFYLDSSDSTALLHPEVLPFVDRYFKGYLLADRQLYGTAHYGNRIFTDYAYRTHGITDEAPAYSTPVTDQKQLNKLGVWWNQALADYTQSGRYRMALYRRFPLGSLLAFPDAFTPPSAPRPNDVSCRMGTHYARDTVAWYRHTARKRLGQRVATDRISYGVYTRELRHSKVVISPFGWGEITHKDFETFLAGAALVKPDMTHMETWPDLYKAGETYRACQWNGEDLTDVVEDLLANPARAYNLAAQGQKVYQDYLQGKNAADAFCQRVRSLVDR